MSVSVLRKFQNDVLKEHIVCLPNIKTVLNVGACLEDGDKEGVKYIDYFLNKEYYTLDKNRNNDQAHHFNLDLYE